MVEWVTRKTPDGAEGRGSWPAQQLEAVFPAGQAQVLALIGHSPLPAPGEGEGAAQGQHDRWRGRRGWDRASLSVFKKGISAEALLRGGRLSFAARTTASGVLPTRPRYEQLALDGPELGARACEDAQATLH